MKCTDLKTILTRFETINQDMEQILFMFGDWETETEADLNNHASLVDIDDAIEKLIDIQKDIAEQLCYLGGCRETVRSKLYDKVGDDDNGS